MADEQPIASPTVIGRRFNLTAPTPAQLQRITDAILDAQDAVEAYLNRPLYPTVHKLVDQVPRDGYDLTDYRAWAYEDFDDDVAVVAVEAGTVEGRHNVTLSVGLDGPRTRPVVRYVTAHAVESLRADPESGMGAKVVKSVSAEGQSVSYETKNPTGADAGALPTLESLRAFRRYSVYKANRPPRAPWPHSSTPVGWDPR